MSHTNESSKKEESVLERACAALNDGDYVRAIELFQTPELKSEGVALNCLAWCYLFGKGTEENDSKALECLQQAIELGYWRAASNLAMLHELGVGVEKNEGRAFELYKQAAVHGETKAEDELSRMYMTGTGVQKDMENARYWSEEAAHERSLAAHTRHFIKSPLLIRFQEPSFLLKTALWMACSICFNSILFFKIFPFLPGYSFLGTPYDALRLSVALWLLGVLVPLFLALLMALCLMLLTVPFGATVNISLAGPPGQASQPSLPDWQKQGINWFFLCIVYCFAVRILADFYPNVFIITSWLTTLLLAAILAASATLQRVMTSPHTKQEKVEMDKEVASLRWIFD